AGSTAADLIKVATAGTLVLQAYNTYTGQTVVNNGQITLNSSGSIATSSSVTVNQGGTMLLDNSIAGVNITNRLGVVPVNLNGGTLSLLGSASPIGMASVATIGTITLQGGSNFIAVQGGTLAGDSATIQAAGLSRLPGSTVVFSPTTNTALGQGTFGQTGA